MEDSERRAFERYGLAIHTHFLALDEPQLRVRVLEAGSGPPLVLLGGPSASAWLPLMAQLQGFRMLAIDRPGCGLSDPFDYTDADVRAHAVSFLSSVMERMDVDRAGFVGNSMGGLWGFWLALDRPALVSSITQLGCPALLLGTSAPLANRVMSVRGVNRIAPTASKHMGGAVNGPDGLPPEMRECLHRAKLIWARGRTHQSMIERTLHLSGARPDLRLGERELAAIDHPVLFVWGEDDEYGRPETGRRACTLMPNARLMVMGAGHLPWLDHPAACGATIRQFLRPSADPTTDGDGEGEWLAAHQLPEGKDAAIPTPGTELEWVRAVLWPEPQARKGPDRQRFTVFPSRRRPLVLTPLATHATASVALRRYNALRPPRRRLVRGTVALGLRAGIVQPFLRGRLWPPDGLDAGPGGEELAARLREVFGVHDIVMSVSLSRPGPFRKPMLQAMTPDGRVLGYVKVGWNGLTRELVRNEASTLELCAASHLPAIGLPHLIHSGAVGRLEICVTAPLPPRIRRYRQGTVGPTVPALREMAELGGLEQVPFAQSMYWAFLGERLVAVDKASPGRISEALADFAGRLAEASGEEALPFGFWHGDWVPWNLGWSAGRLFAWDWEHSGANVPLGFDLLHFGFHRRFIAGRQTFAEAAARSRGPGLDLMRALGFTAARADIVFRLYLLEAFLRYHEPSIAGSGRDRRFDPETAIQVFDGASPALAART